jgi:hypothetical protein
VLEMIVKLLARIRKGRLWPLVRDDADWWIEWIVAATIALALFLIINAHEHKPVSTWQVVTALAAIFFGYAALPRIASVFCLDDNGRVASIPALFVLDLFALFMLAATVSVGVKI